MASTCVQIAARVGEARAKMLARLRAVTGSGAVAGMPYPMNEAYAGLPDAFRGVDGAGELEVAVALAPAVSALASLPAGWQLPELYRHYLVLLAAREAAARGLGATWARLEAALGRLPLPEPGRRAALADCLGRAFAQRCRGLAAACAAKGWHGACLGTA
jgi:hypothetical protein